jgi:hypothetical protein
MLLFVAMNIISLYGKSENRMLRRISGIQEVKGKERTAHCGA